MTVTLSNFSSSVDLGNNLPTTTRIPLMTDIYEWWRGGDNQTLVETDKLSLIKGRIDINKQATSGTSGERPTYSATGLSGKPAIIFDGVNDHLSFPMTGSGFFASDFSLAFIFKPTALPASQGYILSTFSAANVGTLVYMTSAGQLRFQHGDAYLSGAITVDAPTVVVLSLEGEFLRGRINGVDMLSTLGVVTKKSGLQHGTVSLVMGAITNTVPSNAGAFALSDFIPFTGGIVSDLRRCREIEEYAARVYDVTLPAYW